MAKVNPIQAQKFLSGLDYPASKQQIVDHAQNQGADENVRSALEQIPDREYNGPNAVSAELGNID